MLIICVVRGSARLSNNSDATTSMTIPNPCTASTRGRFVSTQNRNKLQHRCTGLRKSSRSGVGQAIRDREERGVLKQYIERGKSFTGPE